MLLARVYFVIAIVAQCQATHLSSPMLWEITGERECAQFGMSGFEDQAIAAQ